MLTDPIAITGNGAAESFARESTEKRKTVYSVLARAAGNECKLTLNHEEVGSGIDRRVRSVFRVEDNITLSDAATPGKNIIQLTVDRPVSQATDTAVLESLRKVTKFLDVGANAQALIDGQS
jgi:hypothetical protein